LLIDGCNRSFDELSRKVLPQYIKKLRKRIDSPIPFADFNVKGVGPVTLQRRFGLDHDPTGCYVLLDGDKPIYVGISKQLIKRLREHVRGADHLSATLAYRIASQKYPHGMTAKRAMQNPKFRARFEEARSYLLTLNVAFVEIENPLELYLFEPYCAMKLDTGFDVGGWNTFITH